MIQRYYLLLIFLQFVGKYFFKCHKIFLNSNQGYISDWKVGVIFYIFVTSPQLILGSKRAYEAIKMENTHHLWKFYDIWHFFLHCWVGKNIIFPIKGTIKSNSILKIIKFIKDENNPFFPYLQNSIFFLLFLLTHPHWSIIFKKLIHNFKMYFVRI